MTLLSPGPRPVPAPSGLCPRRRPRSAPASGRPASPAGRPASPLPSWLLAIGCTVAGAISADGAVAAPAGPLAGPLAQLDDEPRRVYTIPGGRLSDVLAQFAASAGVPLSFDPQLLDGLTSDGLQATVSVREGFARLLAGSGHELVELGAGRYTLRRRPDGAARGATDRSVGTTLPSVTVTASRTAESADLPAAYAGGQVASGGRVGMLGARNVFDTPFSVNYYTSDLVRQRQARTLNDVITLSPSVQANSAPSSEREEFMIRGFGTANSDIYSVNGLFGLAGSSKTSLEPFERVELIRGASAMLNGNPNGVVAGTVNLVPKRGTDAPLSRLGVDYLADDVLGVGVDLGRRFGPANAIGIRVNAVRRKGDTNIDAAATDQHVAALALDYRGERLRAALDLFDQAIDNKGAQAVFFNVAPGVAIPAAPRGSANTNQDWAFSRNKNRFALASVEYDVSSRVTAFAHYGYSEGDRREFTDTPYILNSAGDVENYMGPSANRQKTRTGDIGLRARLDTGPVSHQLSAVYTHLEAEGGSARAANSELVTYPSNIYRPTRLAPVTTDIRTRPLPKSSESEYGSLAVADTLGFFNDRVLATLGLRRQRVESRGFNAAGAQNRSYDESRWTPAVGVLAKVGGNWSVYSSYIEALGSGSTAPANAANAGEIFAPQQAEALEIGAKWNGGDVGATLALFDMKNPSFYTDPTTRVFGLLGEQRNRGFEAEIFGQPWRQVRLIGGLAYTRGELVRTAGGENDGNVAVGVPRFRAKLFGEYDLAALPGLSLGGGLIYSSAQYYDPANTQRIPGWTRVDLGARYLMRVLGRETMVRASLINVLDKDYWQSAGRGNLSLAAPRTLMVSLSTDL